MRSGWEDMTLYWAWRGGPEGYCQPPTVKRIEYSQVGSQRVASAVWDDDKRTELPLPSLGQDQ